jgi:hypothetical protein
MFNIKWYPRKKSYFSRYKQSSNELLDISEANLFDDRQKPINPMDFSIHQEKLQLQFKKYFNKFNDNYGYIG